MYTFGSWSKRAREQEREANLKLYAYYVLTISPSTQYMLRFRTGTYT
jgi:hypothetical protein